MKIEVKWEVRPRSGVTYLDLNDLHCKSRKAWDKLTNEEQEIRINKYLLILYHRRARLIGTKRLFKVSI